MLVVHQNILDLFTSFFMVITYSVKLCNIYLTGSVGYLLCTFIISDSLIWLGSVGSVINLAAITIERYLKVVHAAWSQTKLRNWMLYSAMAFAWILPFITNVAAVIPTSAVMDGTCYPYYTIFTNETATLFYNISNVVLFYFVVLFIFIFCYWRILVVIGRQAKVMMTSHNAAGPCTAQTHAQIQSHQIQSNITKTMVFISALYAILWLPINIHVLLIIVHPNQPVIDDLVGLDAR